MCSEYICNCTCGCLRLTTQSVYIRGCQWYAARRDSRRQTTLRSQNAEFTTLQELPLCHGETTRRQSPLSDAIWCPYARDGIQMSGMEGTTWRRAMSGLIKPLGDGSLWFIAVVFYPLDIQQSSYRRTFAFERNKIRSACRSSAHSPAFISLCWIRELIIPVYYDLALTFVAVATVFQL